MRRSEDVEIIIRIIHKREYIIDVGSSDRVLTDVNGGKTEECQSIILSRFRDVFAIDLDRI